MNERAGRVRMDVPSLPKSLSCDTGKFHHGEERVLVGWFSKSSGYRNLIGQLMLLVVIFLLAEHKFSPFCCVLLKFEEGGY